MFRLADNKNPQCEKLINEFLVNDDVNRRQEILLALKSTLSQPTMAEYLGSSIEHFKTLKTDSSNLARVSCLLGFLYRIKEDFNSASPYIDTAIALKDPIAMYLKGFIHLRGLGNIPVDKVKAMEYYRDASNLNHGMATYNLAVLLSQGPRNREYAIYDEVRDLFFKAAKLGYKPSRDAFNAMENQSYFIHQPFLRQPVSVLPPPNETDVPCTQSFLATTDFANNGMGFVPVEHTFWLPAAFAKLPEGMQTVFLKSLRSRLEDVYFQHAKNYLSIFKEEPFKAEQEKIKFTNNRHILIQNAVEKFSKQYFENGHTISSPIPTAAPTLQKRSSQHLKQVGLFATTTAVALAAGYAIYHGLRP